MHIILYISFHTLVKTVPALKHSNKSEGIFRVGDEENGWYKTIRTLIMSITEFNVHIRDDNESNMGALA